jgi:HEAT repeat protein
MCPMGIARARRPAERVDAEVELARRPAAGEHWDDIAERLVRLADPRGIAVLRAALRDGSRPCCTQRLRWNLGRLVTAHGVWDSPQARALAAEWWDSTEEWEAEIAVRIGHGDPLDRIDVGRPAVARAAVRSLNRRGTGDEREIAVLADIVRTTEPALRHVREEAVRRLQNIGGAAATRAVDECFVEPYVPPWWHDRGWLHRNRAKAVPLLIGKLDEARWWYEAPFGLGTVRAVEAVEPLGRFVRDAVQNAASSEYRIGADAALRRAVWGLIALGKIGAAEAVPVLREMMACEYAGIRDHALLAMTRIGNPEVVDAAVGAADDPDPAVRDRAARVLCAHGDGRAVTVLLRLCDGPHAVRALHALTRIGDPRALPTLWRLFRTGRSREVRHAAGRGLARIEGPDRPGPLPDDPSVRLAYLWLLGQRPEWEPTSRLRRWLTHDDPLVRARAAESLYRLGGATAEEHLRPLLDDPDRRVRDVVRHRVGPRHE